MNQVDDTMRIKSNESGHEGKVVATDETHYTVDWGDVPKGCRRQTRVRRDRVGSKRKSGYTILD